jgi:hypothetical protein
MYIYETQSSSKSAYVSISWALNQTISVLEKPIFKGN